MRHNREYETFARCGVQPPRSYYVPFGLNCEWQFKHGILNRQLSDRFISLDGEWAFEAYSDVCDVDENNEPSGAITVPSCVQMQGYDSIQYLNTRYPMPVDPPYIRVKNPSFHYRKRFTVADTQMSYYINFEGVDSFFYLFINGERAGYSQISHSTSEFDITEFIKEGDNTVDVVVLKWCAGSYLECQDKFRFTGIFRSVYVLARPRTHVTDFKITAELRGGGGVLTVQCLDNAFKAEFCGEVKTAQPDCAAVFTLPDARPWTAENPVLYDLVISAYGEKILQRVGFRTSAVEDGVYKINGGAIKLKGVNRHEFSPTGGATVTLGETIKDLQIMKWANVNAIRTCHYPDCPEFYDLCDAMGFYIVDEADVETHGMAARNGGYDRALWQNFADSGIADGGVTDREITLYERDKNRTCVVIWSLGNEANFGKMFFGGADYIRARDSRPVFYENTWEMADRTGYYSHRIDIAGRMYPPLGDMRRFLRDKKEKRPLLLCEYSHAMGNSNGDLNDYWNIIDGNERFVGAFVWEWRDHAIKTDKGYLYGGDFGENEHDGNFCVDGLLNPDWTYKSGLYEMRAVYGGKREKKPPVIKCEPLAELNAAPVSYCLGREGELASAGNLRFTQPVKFNVFRAYIDNDRLLRGEWKLFEAARQTAYDIQTQGNRVTVTGKMLADCCSPVADFTLIYTFYDGAADIELHYKAADCVRYLPRAGITFALPLSEADEYVYKGYGPYESYADKHLASEYGEYAARAQSECFGYVKPQESGSHYCCTEVRFKNGIRITALKPFSMSAIPYSAHTLANAAHIYELPESCEVHVSLDAAMSGVGSHSCGPELNPKYRAPKEGGNIFRIYLNSAARLK